MADPIALSAALQIGHDQIHHVAEFTRELADSPAIALTPRTGSLEAPAADDDYVDCIVDGDVVRYPPPRRTASCGSNLPAVLCGFASVRFPRQNTGWQ